MKSKKNNRPPVKKPKHHMKDDEVQEPDYTSPQARPNEPSQSSNAEIRTNSDEAKQIVNASDVDTNPLGGEGKALND